MKSDHNGTSEKSVYYPWRLQGFSSIGNLFRQAGEGRRRNPARRSLPARGAGKTPGRSRTPAYSVARALTRRKEMFPSCWPSSRRNHRSCMVRHTHKAARTAAGGVQLPLWIDLAACAARGEYTIRSTMCRQHREAILGKVTVKGEGKANA
jgi:hypothetical protein